MKCLVFTIMLLLAMPQVAQAVDDVDGMHANELALLRSVLHAERKAVVEANILLSDAEARGFWSVYHAYRMEMNDANDQTDALILKYTELYRADTTTDDDAMELLNDFQVLQKKALAVKRKYIKRFQKVITSKKVARFYQIDQRLDNIEQLELVQGIPLFE